MMFEVRGECSQEKIFANELEKGAVTQIRNLCDQPFTEGAQFRLMPDAHMGAGCVIGTTMTINDKIMPNLVDVDISCGVEGVKLDANDIDFAGLDAIIREKVPSGIQLRKRAHELAEGFPSVNLPPRRLWPRQNGPGLS